jgi:hypothetical protein
MLLDPTGNHAEGVNKSDERVNIQTMTEEGKE